MYTEKSGWRIAAEWGCIIGTALYLAAQAYMLSVGYSQIRDCKPEQVQAFREKENQASLEAKLLTPGLWIIDNLMCDSPE